MLIVAGLFSVILVAVIAYLALSKTSTRPVRIAATIALCIVGATIVACSLFLVVVFLGGSGEGKGASDPDLPPVPVVDKRGDIIGVVIFALILVVFIGVIIILSMREQKRLKAEKLKKDLKKGASQKTKHDEW
jgi:hypothetical protein